MRRAPSIPPAHSLTIAVIGLVLGVLVLLFGISCSGNPNAPSASVSFVSDPGPGCTPAPHVPTLPTVFTVQATAGSDGFASWIVNGQTVTATFKELVPGTGVFGLCAWSMGEAKS